MGFLRIYLAIVVLLSHCPQGIIFQKISHPALAVQCFYAISGFYIQLLINQFKNSHRRWKLAFYLNRAIRIYPTYLIILIISILLLPDSLALINGKSTAFKSLFFIDNFLILPQGLMRFLHIDITVLPQSWTLSLELIFYIIAPYLLTQRNTTLVLLFVFSIVCRVMLASYDLYLHNWFYEFFPSEIGIFLGGSLGYRFYSFYLSEVDGIKYILYKIFSFFLFLYLAWFTFYGYHNINIGVWDGKSTLGVPMKYWCVLLLTIVSLPFVFNLTRNSKIDRYIGEFSYPLYLGHFLFISLIEKKHVSLDYENIIVLVLTSLLCLLIMHTVEIPLTKLREKLKRKKHLYEAKKLEAEVVPAVE
jgi:peptidoglycan/LPS O-acetylase OafA/YrhL